MIKSLERFSTYSREEAHGIFAPETSFTPQAGSWGLHGVVSIPERPNNYVFFVTFGQSQGGHQFDEGITEEGVLTWQSQPRQGLDDQRVQSWINHDDLKDNIYLFLRGSKGIPYTYLGRLKYISHDVDREKLVYFQWQIIDWEGHATEVETLGIPLQETSGVGEGGDISTHSPPPKGLTKDEAPDPKKTTGKKTRSFRARKGADYSDADSKNKKLGLAGELSVLEMEIDRLRAEGLNHLADKVVHTAVVEGDGAGYDIKSYRSDGSVKYIEVKTTRGSKDTSFYISPNEIVFSRLNSDLYELIRVFNYDDNMKSGSYYVLVGDMSQCLHLEPTQFRASVGKPSETHTGPLKSPVPSPAKRR